MYSIFADGVCIYDDTSVLTEFKLINPRFVQQDNMAGSLSFTMAKTNPGYNLVEPFENEIQIKKNGVVIWTGRPITETKNFYNQKTITCEGCYGYLNDSIQPQHNYNRSTVRAFLTGLINNHNSQSNRHFSVRTVTDDGSSHNFTTNYENTLECINMELIENIGGHISVEKIGDTYYLDYIYSLTYTSSQVIRFGKNLLDFTQDLDRTDIATVIIPLGAVINYDDETGFENRVNITSVNGGKNYLESTEAISEYGRIVKVKTWDYVEDPSQLKSIGERYLQAVQFEPVQLSINAVDLTNFGVDTEEFKILDLVGVVSDPHGLNKYLGRTVYTLGTYSDTTLSQNSNAVQNYMYNVTKEYNKKISETYAMAKDAAESTIVSDTLKYLATSLDSEVTINTPGWSTTPQSITEENKYLWTYHTYTYGDEHISNTLPVISGVYGDEGQDGERGPAGPKGDTGDTGATGPQGPAGTDGQDGQNGISIISVTPLWYCSDSSTVPSAPASEVTTTSTGTGIWTKGVPALSATYKYLYTCDQVKYSDNTFTWTTPVLHNALSEAYSEILQMADTIVLKVKNNGQVVTVALGEAAGEGTDIRLSGQNIILDGDVRITDGFTLSAGVIQSSNYLADTRGMKITLLNGALDTKNFKILADGNVESTNLYATSLIFRNDILFNVSNVNNYFIKYTSYGDAGWYEIYNTDVERAISLGGNFQGTHGPKNILRGQWWAEELQIGGVADYTTTAGSRPGVIISKDNEGGQVSILGTSRNWAIDCYDNASLRFMLSTGTWIRFASDGTIRFKNNSRVAVGSYNDSTFTLVNDIIKITSSNHAVMTCGSSNYSFSIASWSDTALKTNIKDSKVDGLDIIMKIKLREFDFKEKEYGTHEDIGYVANELVKIIPEAVVEVPISDEDKEKYGKDYLYQVNDGAIVKYLVKAVQEQQKQIYELKEMVRKLIAK